MADRPIIFSGPMVRALLDGRKTQTRRLATSPLRRCVVGDRLYVRETAAAVELDDGQDGIRFAADGVFQPIANSAAAAEAWGIMHCYARPADDDLRPQGKQVPSIHMPRWASRLTLIVEAVRVEPLPSISREDAIAEGLIHKPGVIEPDWWMLPEPHHQGSFLSPVAAYRWLWNDLHTGTGERWEDNPLVLALTFRVERGNIDQVPA